MPWFNDPAALDRPLAAGGPASWAARRRLDRARPCRSARSPKVEGLEHPHHRDVGVVRRLPHRGPGDGEDLVLPELEGRGRRRAVAGHAQLHGGRADQPPRDGSTFGTSTADWVGTGAHASSGCVGLGGLVWWGAAPPGRDAGRFRCGAASAEGTISVPLHGGEDPRLPVPDCCARRHLQGLRRSRDLSRRARRVGRPPHRQRLRGVHRVGPRCSSGATRARRRSRWWPPSSRARMIAGADVVDLGLASTDLCYFAAGTLDAPAAMFTASHNPAAVQRRQAVPGGRAADRRRTPAWPRSRPWSPGGCSSGPRTRAGSSSAISCPPFVAHVRSFVDLDALPAAAGRGRHRQRRRRPHRRPRCSPGCRSSSTILFGELDGTFPNHPADPTSVENLKDLQRAVLDAQAPTSGSRSTATPTASSSSTTRRSRCRARPPPRSSRRRSSTSTRARRSCTT